MPVNVCAALALMRCQQYAEQVGAVAAERGEAWQSCLAPEEMSAMLEKHGFGAIQHFRQHDAVDAALWNRTDSLRPSELSRIVLASC
jgi:O-methyltransferase involved in polyketide biosynthesis